MRRKLQTDFGWELSQTATEMCIFFKNVTVQPTFGHVLDAHDVKVVQQTMNQSLTMGQFEEGTAERALNMFKLGTDRFVKASKAYQQGDIVAILGPHAAYLNEPLPAAETYHMQAAFFGDKQLVWSPSTDVDDPASIGSYVTDCNTFDVAEPVHANIDYHTTYYVSTDLKVPIPIIVANQDIEAGQMIVGDFGATFFLEPRYMIPNMKAMAQDEVTRKRKRSSSTGSDDAKRFKTLLSKVASLDLALEQATKANTIYEQAAEQAQADFAAIQTRFQAMRGIETKLEAQVLENNKLMAKLVASDQECRRIRTQAQRLTERNITLEKRLHEQFERLRDVGRKNVELSRLLGLDGDQM
ncbi:MAG: hypothetical protein CMP20_02745 [Rickettsiales bacterium]|nr:hypothetical protein [Rickettsiales bacterium]